MIPWRGARVTGARRRLSLDSAPLGRCTVFLMESSRCGQGLGLVNGIVHVTVSPRRTGVEGSPDGPTHSRVSEAPWNRSFGIGNVSRPDVRGPRRSGGMGTGENFLKSAPAYAFSRWSASLLSRMEMAIFT